MKTSSVKILAILLVTCMSTLLLYSSHSWASPYTARVRLTKAVDLGDDQLRAVEGVLCGELEASRWLPGKVLRRNGNFISFLGISQRFRRKADRAEDEEQEERFFIRSRKMKRRHRQQKSSCAQFSDGSPDTGTPPPGNGQFIVHDPQASFPSGNNVFESAYYAYLDGQKVFTIAVAKNTRQADALHAVHVGLEYLDNDEDGHCDNPVVCAALASTPRGAIVYINAAQEDRFDPWNPTQSLQVNDVYRNSAIYPGGTEQIYDFTLEEVLHYLTDNGWTKAYPAVFGGRQSSEWGQLVQSAIRQGKYDPLETGDTELDDYETTVPESLYWVITSRTGSHDYSWRTNEIEAEWPNYNRNRLQQNLSSMLAIIEDPQYGFPQRTPDGDYAPASQ